MTQYDLSEQVAVVTGGAGFLGQKYVKCLARHGATVVAADIAYEGQAQARYPDTDRSGSIIRQFTDVTEESSVAEMIEMVTREMGRLDVLVNNAAIDPKFDGGDSSEYSTKFEDYPLKSWQQTLEVNLTGSFLCARYSGHLLKQDGGGVVVNVSSTYGLVGPDQRLYQGRDRGQGRKEQIKPADYSVSKGGIIALTKYLATYWGNSGIRVNTLTPGGVYKDHDAEFVERYSARTPMGRMGRWDEIADALMFLVSDASSYMTGANLVVDGGWTAW